MKSVAKSYIWWLGLDEALEEVVKSCITCQAVKHSKLLLQYSHGHVQISPGREYIWTLLVPFKARCFSLLLMLILSGQQCLL